MVYVYDGVVQLLPADSDEQLQALAVGLRVCQLHCHYMLPVWQSRHSAG